MNPSFISLIGILFGILGANSILFWNKKKSIGLIGNSIVGVYSSVLYIKIVGRIFNLKTNSNSDYLMIIIIFVGSFIVSLIFVYLTKKVLLNLKRIKKE